MYECVAMHRGGGEGGGGGLIVNVASFFEPVCQKKS